MKERGILMSEWSIKRYQAGLKTQTRRTKGLERINENPDDWKIVSSYPEGGIFDFECFKGKSEGNYTTIKCPYGGIGDEVWLKETWATLKCYDNLPPRDIPDFAEIFYMADNPQGLYGYIGKTRSSMFMTKWASRFPHVPITGLRCERLKSITEADAIAEGCKGNPNYEVARAEYYYVWDSINGKTLPVSVNPWCWAITFPKYEVVK